jgi:hypothetical protein
MEFWGSSFNFIVPSAYPLYVQDFLDRMTARDVAAGDSGGLQVEVTDLISNTLQALVNGGFLTVSANVISAASSIIKTGGFLTGARTIQGALTPWGAGMPIPTIFNFVAGDYNRKTGALGNGTNKYVLLGVNSNSVPQNSCHQSVMVTTAPTVNSAYIGTGAQITGAMHIQTATTTLVQFRNRNSVVSQHGTSPAAGFFAHSRNNSANYSVRYANTSATVTQASETPINADTGLFARISAPSTASLFSNARQAAWTFGEAVPSNDLVALETIITGYMNSLNALTLT